MWELLSDWESIASAQLGESTVLVLEFSDDCMLLVAANEESSGGLEQEFSSQLMDTGSQFLESEVKLAQLKQ
jgi:hypothetical protein